MKKKALILIAASTLLSTSFAVIGLNNFVQVSGYEKATLIKTINLNDSNENTIRNYYSTLNSLSASEKQGTNLLKNLKPILKNDQEYFSYESGDDIWKLYEITDRDWDLSPASAIPGYDSNTNMINNYTYGSSGTNPYLHALYVNRDVTNETKAHGDHTQTNWGINREHIWPKSHGFENEGVGGARGDPIHLWSANGYANNIHNNNFYGFVDRTKSFNDLGKDYSFISNNLSGTSKTMGSNTVFEPQDSDKGDIARSVFYMVARYNYYSGIDEDGIDTNNPNLELVQSSNSNVYAYTSTTELTGKMGVLSDLLAWNHLDPVDEFEIHRNNLLFNNYTNNRNPFIDFPDWADYIWGTADLDGTNYSSQLKGHANPTIDPISTFSPEIPDTPTAITLNRNNETLGVDQTFQTSVISSVPANAGKEVNWSITNGAGNVSVSSDGLITALQVGNAVVTATSTLDSEVTASINISVVVPKGVTSVTINKSTTTLEKYASETLSANVLPSNATNKKVTWSSDDNSTVSVTSNGLITAIKAGTATITVKTEDGNFTDSCFVTVTSTTHTEIVISEAYGGGGNSGAPYKQDFVELYNNTNFNINLSGYRLFYATGAGAFDASTVTNLKGTILAKSYFLIEEDFGTDGTNYIPTADVVGSIPIAAAAFKLALTNNSNVPAGPTDSNVVDFVGAGGAATLFEGSKNAPGPSATKSISRVISSGIAIDTNKNGSDFKTGSPTPMNGAISVATRIMNYEGGDISTPQCSSKYAAAKAQIIALTTGSLSYFQNSTESIISNARTRYIAWANANGDANPYSSSQGSSILAITNDNYIAILLLISGIGLAMTMGYFYFRKKKRILDI